MAWAAAGSSSATWNPNPLGSGQGWVPLTQAVSNVIAARFSGDGRLNAIMSPALIAQFSGSGALHMGMAGGVSMPAQFSGVGMLSATIAARFVRTAAFSGSGSLTALMYPSFALAAPFSGVGTLSADIQQAIAQAIAANFSGNGALAATISPRMLISPAFSSTGALSFVVRPQFARNATFAGAGSLACTIVGKVPLQFDSVGAGGSASGSGATISTSEIHDPVAGGIDIFAALKWTKVTGSASPTRTVTCGGTNMTLLGQFVGSALTGSGNFGEVYRLSGVSSASQNIAATVAGTGLTLSSINLQSIAYQGVSNVGALQNNSGSGISFSATANSAVGHIPICFFTGGNIVSYPSNWTQRISTGTITGDAVGAATVGFSGNQSVTGGWNITFIDLS